MFLKFAVFELTEGLSPRISKSALANTFISIMNGKLNYPRSDKENENLKKKKKLHF